MSRRLLTLQNVFRNFADCNYTGKRNVMYLKYMCDSNCHESKSESERYESQARFILMQKFAGLLVLSLAIVVFSSTKNIWCWLAAWKTPLQSLKMPRSVPWDLPLLEVDFPFNVYEEKEWICISEVYLWCKLGPGSALPGLKIARHFFKKNWDCQACGPNLAYPAEAWGRSKNPLMSWGHDLEGIKM